MSDKELTTTQDKTLVPWVETIKKAEKKFMEIVRDEKTAVTFAAESMFAFQSLSKNEYLQRVAQENLPSLRDSIINIASIGLSLNPAMQFAYLVPRDKAVCLDISYKGLIKLATDTGSMLWVRADLVYENDNFVYRGPASAPTHEANVFGDRGPFVGVYCIGKTIEGDMLVEVMTSKEIEQVRDSSEYYKKRKAGPWKDWFGEMAKKTIIKRASKTWPRTDKSDRLAKAVEVINEHEGFNEHEIHDAVQLLTDDQELELSAFINENEIDKARFLKWAGVNEISEISQNKFAEAKIALKEMIK